MALAGSRLPQCGATHTVVPHCQHLPRWRWCVSVSDDDWGGQGCQQTPTASLINLCNTTGTTGCQRQQYRVHVVGVGYCSDTCMPEKVTKKQQQHETNETLMGELHRAGMQSCTSSH